MSVMSVILYRLTVGGDVVLYVLIHCNGGEVRSKHGIHRESVERVKSLLRKALFSLKTQNAAVYAALPFFFKCTSLQHR